MGGDHPNNSIIENGQNTKKSPGDLRRLAVTQTPVKKTSANADVKSSNNNSHCYNVSRKKVGRGLASIEDSVDASIQRRENYVKKRGGRLITATRNNADNTGINRIKIIRKQKGEEKQLYGHIKR